MERQDGRRGRVAVRPSPNWVGLGLGVLGAGLVWAGVAFGQTIPEVVQPGSGGAVTPPTAGDGRPVPTPRSESPLVDGGVRPVPDNGVIAPSARGGVIAPPVQGAPMVVPPPATGPMPVIPPPGSAGGDRTVVPK